MDAQLITAVLSKLRLRSYQGEAVQAFFAASRDRTKVKVISLPTGAGKTVVGVVIAACLIAAGYAPARSRPNGDLGTGVRLFGNEVGIG